MLLIVDVSSCLCACLLFYARLEEAVNSLIERLDFYDHHFEHELATVSDTIDHLTAKVKNGEGQGEVKIQGIDDIVRKQLESALDARLPRLEAGIISKSDQGISTAKTELVKKIESLKATGSIGTSSKSDSGGGWYKFLFYTLLISIVVVLPIGCYLIYKDFNRRFKLP
jgi:hypothetical protein